MSAGSPRYQAHRDVTVSITAPEHLGEADVARWHWFQDEDGVWTPVIPDNVHANHHFRVHGVAGQALRRRGAQRAKVAPLEDVGRFRRLRTQIFWRCADVRVEPSLENGNSSRSAPGRTDWTAESNAVTLPFNVRRARPPIEWQRVASLCTSRTPPTRTVRSQIRAGSACASRDYDRSRRSVGPHKNHALSRRRSGEDAR